MDLSELDQEKQQRIAGDQANVSSIANVSNQVINVNNALNTEVVHRSEGDLLSQKQYEALSVVLQDKVGDLLNQYLTLKKDNQTDTTKLAETINSIRLAIIGSIQSTNDALNQEIKNRDSQFNSIQKDLSKYLTLLSDITMDSNQITMDNGEIKMGVWTILSQARQWDLDILNKLKDVATSVDTVTDTTNKLVNADDTLTSSIISKAIEQLGQSKIITDLDKELKLSQSDLDAKIDKISTDANKRIDDTNLSINSASDTIKRNIDDLNTAYKAQMDDVTLSVAHEAQVRQSQIDELNTTIDGLSVEANKDLADKIQKVQDDLASAKEGYDKSITTLTKENETSTSEFESFKSTTNNSIAGITESQKTLADKTNSNAETISGISSQINDSDTGLKAIGTIANSASSASTTNANDIKQTNEQLNGILQKVTSNTNDIEATNKLVEQTKGTIDKQGKDISTLTSRVTSFESNITGQVDSLAKANESLTTSVKQNADSISSVSDKTDKLQNILDGKADSTALSNLSSRIDQNDKDITSSQNAITSLSNKVDSNYSANSNNYTYLSNELNKTNDSLSTLSTNVSSISSQVNDKNTGNSALASALNSVKVTVDSNSTTLATKVSTESLQQYKQEVSNNFNNLTNQYAAKSDWDGNKAQLTQSIQNSFNTSLNQLKSDITSTTYSKTDTDSAISRGIDSYSASLVIGGRNLILNSNFYRKTMFGWGINGGNFSVGSDSQYGTYAFVSGGTNNGLFVAPNSGWKLNETYTFSMMLRNTSVGITFGIEGSNILSGNTSITISGADFVWKKYTVTFKKVSTTGAVVIYLQGSGSYDITNAKLEIGTKPTDWSYAPEDINDSISQVSAQVTDYRNAQVSADQALSERLSTAESTLNNQKSNIENIQNTYAKVSEVGSLARNAMTSVFTNGINLARKTDTVDGYLTNGNTGASSNDYLVPTLYPADSGDYFTGTTYTTLSTDDFRGQIAFYNSSLGFIAQYEILKRSQGTITVQAPANTAYFRISYPKSFYGKVKIERGKVGTTYSVAPEDGASLTDLSSFASNIQQNYATKANLESTTADAITQLKSTYVPGSGNLLINPDFSSNSPTYQWRYSGTNNYDGLNVWVGSSDWKLQNTVSNTVYMHSSSLGAGMFDEAATDFLVEGGKTYQLSAYTGAHRCTAIIFAYFWDDSNNVIGNSFNKTSSTTNNAEMAGGRYLSGYKRIYQNVVAPLNCTRMSLVVRRDDLNNSSDPYVFLVRAQALQVSSTDAPLATWVGSTKLDTSKLVDTNLIQSYATKTDLNTATSSVTTQLNSKYSMSGSTNRFYNSDFIFGLDGWNSNGSSNSVSIDQGVAKQTFGASNVVQVVSNGNGSQGLWQTVDNLIAGSKVTISIWMYGFTDNSVGLTFGIADENITPDSEYPQYQTVLAGWNRYRITGTWRNNGNVVMYVHFTAAGQKVMMARPQLEVGSVMTDWKPANGDISKQFDNTATAISNTYTKAEVDNVVSSSSNILKSSIDSNTATISTILQTSNGNRAVGGLTINNNGYIVGMGFLSEIINGRATSSVNILADNFTVGSGNNSIKPFIVSTSPQWIDGVLYPTGLWANMGTFADASIGNAKIGSLDAGKITSGFISSDRIQAKSISVDKLTVGDLTNLWSNRYFEDGKPTIGIADSWYPPIGKARIINSRDNITDWNNRVEVREGDVIITEFDGQPQQSKQPLTAGMWVTDVSGNYPNGSYGWQSASCTEIRSYPDSLWKRYRAISTITGSNAAYGRLYFNQAVDFGDTSSIWHIANVTQTRGTKGELIVNGSITGDQIKGNSITADKLSVGSLSAITGNFGSFTTSNSNGSMSISGASLTMKYPNGVTGIYIGIE